MEISNRDTAQNPAVALRSQAGQAVIEYLLMMVITIAIIMGGMYQLNTAFRAWAQEYFANYIGCLLETGELPSISGSSGGDSGICNQFFKPFNLQDGRKLASQTAQYNPSSSSSSSNSGGGSRENLSRGSSGYGNYNNVSRFNPSRRPPVGIGGRGVGKRGGASDSDTGNTDAKGYGTDYGNTNRKLNTDVKERVDTGFAFEDESEDKQKRRSFASNAPRPDESRKSRTIIRSKTLKKDANEGEESGFSFGNFLRILIIAAIIIALVLLIGGQMLQISKSSE